MTRTMWLRSWVFAVLSAWMVSAASADVGGVIAALERMDESGREEWAFTMRSAGRGQTSVARHDPRDAEGIHGWRLLKIDGEVPKWRDRARFHKFVKRMKKEEKGELRQLPQTLSELVRFETLERVGRDGEGLSVYRFVPGVDDSKYDKRDVLTGELGYDSRSGRVLYIRVRNQVSYWPKFAVRIDFFSMEMRFAPHRDQTALISTEARIRGKASFLRGMDETFRFTFSDHEWLGEAARAGTGGP